MACYSPVIGWIPSDGGSMVFHEVKNSREVKVPCGQCIGCRIDRRDMWATRCYAESKMHEKNCFITLTYNEDNYPLHGSLNHRHFQLFMKRLRKQFGPVRFFMAGEYGEELSRPHYHALLFGIDFDDKYFASGVQCRDRVYRSATLERLWPFGFSTIGEVTYASARYCSAYICKRVTGKLADEHYTRVDISSGELVKVEPEYCRMSLKPGIGATYLEKYWRDLYKSGANGVVINGQSKRIPRYFHQVMENLLPFELEEFKYEQSLKVDYENNTAQRLAVREEVAKAREKFNKERYQ